MQNKEKSYVFDVRVSIFGKELLNAEIVLEPP
jgi:hypothetical protein